MGAGNWFWIIFVVLFICGGFYGVNSSLDRRWWGGGFVIAVLLGLLGWGIFGPPIR